MSRRAINSRAGRSPRAETTRCPRRRHAPAGGSGTLSAVVMTGAGQAWAVGAVTGEVPLIARLTGGSWRLVTAPAGSGARLHDVAAASATDIWAVGGSVAGSAGTQSPLILHHDGTSWRRVAAPAGTCRRTLTAVTVAGPGDVWAVGHRSQETDLLPVNRTLTLRWDGIRWTPVPSPNVDQDRLDHNELHAVAVHRGSGSTWAVGEYGGSVPRTLTLRLRP